MSAVSAQDAAGTESWLPSSAACERLGVKPATLYAYVSRGLVHSRRGADGRSRLYSAEDLDRLLLRAERRRDPEEQVRGALDWGGPVLDSELTLIEDGRYYYRGRDATGLATSSRIEEVAALLWLGRPEAWREIFPARLEPLPRSWRPALGRVAGAHPGETLQVALRLAASEDPGAFDRRPERSSRCGARILGTLAMAVSRLEHPVRDGVAGALRRGWVARRPDAQPVIDAALVLLADHELNVSSFTARCIASAGSSPYDAVCGGLAALRGFRHGGCSDQMEALVLGAGVGPGMRAAPPRERLREALARRLAAGGPVPGFGHRLYPRGDPRCRALMDLMQERFPSSRVVAALAALAVEGESLLGDRPNVDFALAGLSAELGLRPGGAFAVFALGRTVGWIAHALEEYSRDRLIRPRARYVGAPAGSGR
ncbi:MAG TPA: citrate/2-methylcitrate synthase [Thermoanaerobaculia bacterium]|nr:citrate/2-methylcitrate synthase [Thermoanaerobaculia bacterium]